MTKSKSTPCRSGTLLTETPIDVAIDDEGNFVVVWSGDNTLIQDEDGIFMQRFDYDGDKMGGQVRVNEYRDDVQTDPSVAMVGATGDFVVSWTSFAQDGNQDAIIAKQYSLSGAAKGNEFVVNSHHLRCSNATPTSPSMRLATLW